MATPRQEQNVQISQGIDQNIPTDTGSRGLSREALSVTAPLREIPVEPRYIACIGDSIGLGMSQAMGISGIFGVESTHLIESTNRRKSVRDQLNNVDPQKTPYLVIQGGTNDLGENPEIVARNLLSIYQEALKKGFKKVTLVTITPLNGELGQRAEQVNAILRKKAAQNGINLFDLNAALRNNSAFSLARDGVHPRNYKPIAEVMLAHLRTNPGSMTDVNTDVLAGLQTGDTGATPEEQAQYAELERQHQAGALHGTYLERSNKIDEATAKQDFEKIKNASIADIRFKNRLLKPPAANESLDDRIENLKEETARRIRVYTSEKTGEWYTLDYMKVGGEEHEYKIGLGDILVDPSIKQILVKTSDGKIVYAERGVYNGRVGFGVNGQYLATFTGDKFRIVTNTYLSREDYEKNLKTEDDARVQDSETYVRESAGKVFTPEDEAKLAEIMKQYNIPGLENMGQIDSSKLISFFQNVSGKELLAIRSKVGWEKLKAIFRSTGLQSVVQGKELAAAARDYVDGALNNDDDVVKIFGGKEEFKKVLIKLSKHESGWRPFNWSCTGAMGFYQFIESTARNFINYNPLNPKQAVEQVHKLMKANVAQGCTTPQAILTAHNRGAGAVRQYASNMENLPRDRWGNPAGLGFYRMVMGAPISQV